MGGRTTNNEKQKTKNDSEKMSLWEEERGNQIQIQIQGKEDHGLTCLAMMK